jgi:hypothetical protein
MLAAVARQFDQEIEILLAPRDRVGELDGDRPQRFGEVEGERRRRLEGVDEAGELDQRLLQRAQHLELRLLGEGGVEMGSRQATGDQVDDEAVGRLGDGAAAAPEQADRRGVRTVRVVEIRQEARQPPDEPGDLLGRQFQRTGGIGARGGIDEARTRDAVLERGRTEAVGEPLGERAQHGDGHGADELQRQEEQRYRGRGVAAADGGEEGCRIGAGGFEAEPERQQQRGAEPFDEDVDIAELAADAGETARGQQRGEARAEIGAEHDEEADVEVDEAGLQSREREDGRRGRGLAERRGDEAERHRQERRDAVEDRGQHGDVEVARRPLDEVDAEEEQGEAEQDAHPAAQQAALVEAGLDADADDADQEQDGEMEIERREDHQQRGADIAAGDDRHRVPRRQHA